jgi:CubicO group peptidase (beta-lactamase class C family)
MTLAEKGLIDLDAPVEQYLSGWKFPESGYSKEKVTTRRLLTNSAGLHPGEIGGEYPPGSTMPSLKEYLSESAQLIMEPGTMFLYSNPGFNLLELIVEEVSGREFAVYMEEEVLSPLGMNNSSYEWRNSYRGAVPTGYKPDGRPVAPYVYPVKGSGGLLADLDDLARFVGAGMTGPYFRDHGVLSEESIREMHQPQIEIPGLFSFVADSYGYGHFTETLPEGSSAAWHGGQGNGWMTHFHSIPGSGDGIIILTNSQRSWPFMSQVLNDWAGWRGYRSVGMGVITSATIVLWTIIALLFASVLRQAYRVGRGIITGHRRFAPFSPLYPIGRLAEALIGIAVIGVIAWRSAAAYRFESSIFPGALGWAEAALLSFGAVLILLALFPKSGGMERD